MAEWRFGRGWTDAELAQRLSRARHARRNFDITAPLTAEHGWGQHYSKAVVAVERPGRPEPQGSFQRAWELVEHYAFSDPRIVRAHYDPAVPLLNRVMLIEVQVLGLRYLGSAIVGAVRDDTGDEASVRGFRYDTLDGHFERGSEWFLITKEHATGEILQSIHAVWQRGDLPNAWSRYGFKLLAPRYQRAWHRLAHLRIRDMLGSKSLPPLPRGSRLVTQGPPWVLAPVHQTADGPPPAPIVVEEDAPDAGVKEAV